MPHSFQTSSLLSVNQPGPPIDPSCWTSFRYNRSGLRGTVRNLHRDDPPLMGLLQRIFEPLSSHKMEPRRMVQMGEPWSFSNVTSGSCLDRLARTCSVTSVSPEAAGGASPSKAAS